MASEVKLPSIEFIFSCAEHDVEVQFSKEKIPNKGNSKEENANVGNLKKGTPKKGNSKEENPKKQNSKN